MGVDGGGDRVLQRVDPEAVAAARRAYECFEPYGEDARKYARATRLAPTSCEDEVVGVLSELRGRLPEYQDDPESRFNAEQNALVVRDAGTTAPWSGAVRPPGTSLTATCPRPSSA